MSSIIIEKENSNVDKKSFTAIDTSKVSSIGLNSVSRKEIMKKLKKNRKQIKLQFMRRFPKIGVPKFKSYPNKNKQGALDNINKNNKVHELSMYDPNANETNTSLSYEDNFYPDHHRIKILWHFCLSLFLFAILFLIGSVIYLMARSNLTFLDIRRIYNLFNWIDFFY